MKVYKNRVNVRKGCAGYYLRWYYNGWHYWWFLPGTESYLTDGEKYRTLGTRRLAMSSGQINRDEAQAIRTILNTIEISILTDAGWKAVRIDRNSVTVYDSRIAGAEIEFIAIIGSRDLSETGYSPSEYTPPIPPVVYTGFGMLYNQMSVIGLLPVVDLGSVLFVTNDNPAKVYVYNPATKISALLTIPNITTESSDIAHTINKMWLYNMGISDINLDEWDITLNPFTVVYKRQLTGERISAGLHAINDTLLNTAEFISEVEHNYYETDVTNSPVTNNLKFTGLPNRFVTGDFILTTTGKLISLELDDVALEQHIIQYNYSTGAVEVDINISSIFIYPNLWPYGLFEYNGEIYIAGLDGVNGVIYKIDKTTPYAMTLFDSPAYQINGASQIQSQLTVHFTLVPPYVGNGILYNWYAANNAHGIAPTGWHLPSQADWLGFLPYNLLLVGGYMKEAGYTHWDTPNTGADNSFNFNSKAVGVRKHSTGVFELHGRIIQYWGSNDYGGLAQQVTLSYDSSSLGFGSAPYKEGENIRLIKDDSTDPGYLVDYDGNLYQTVKIGSMVWMAENLKVTHYTDGTPITNVQDDATWAALTSEAYCWYNNTPS